jgi:hypothetical protein
VGGPDVDRTAGNPDPRWIGFQGQVTRRR